MEWSGPEKEDCANDDPIAVESKDSDSGVITNDGTATGETQGED